MHEQPDTRGPVRLAVTIGALGVVFGDIGTSPLYTIQTIFSPDDPHPVALTKASVYGLVSMVVWSVALIVTVKYVLLVMRADNDGEGGILALITLISRGPHRSGRRAAMVLAALGIFGAALFFGDSMITPAISVLSAVEGLKVIEPSLKDAVVPITVVIIIGLFLAQRLGTAKVGGLFGPIMIVWFSSIGIFGIKGIVDYPSILLALSPSYALGFLINHFTIAFFALAAVVLAITGAEALYADMGHFGRRPITQAWLALVFPACLLSYLGQGALVLSHPSAVSSPFFLLIPSWGRIPMIVLATAATVIASQAVITGAFSIAHQAVQLGYLPRLRILHTSDRAIGQIYVPLINWVLLVSVVALVLAFRSSAALAFAFGMAVTVTIATTTVLYFYVVRTRWNASLWIVMSGSVAFLAVELLFLAANLTKLAHGAWLPLLIGLVVFTILTTWQTGRGMVTTQRERDEGPLDAFVENLHSLDPGLPRVAGTAVFLNRGRSTTPLALRANVEHNHVLHERVVVLAIETLPVPYVPESDRIDIDHLSHANDGITHVSVRFGYMDEPDVPAALALAKAAGLESEVHTDDVSYFLSTIELRAGHAPGMSRWRKRLFLATASITVDAADYFNLPRNRTVVIGSRVTL